MPILGDVEYQEMQGSGRYTNSADGEEGTLIFKVAWADSLAFVRELRGQVLQEQNASSELVTTVTTPHTFPGLSYLECVHAERQPLLGQEGYDESGTTTYSQARVVATYRRPPYRSTGQTSNEDAYVDLSVEIFDNYDERPGREFYWRDAPFLLNSSGQQPSTPNYSRVSLDTPVVVPNTRAEVRITKRRIPATSYTLSTLMNAVGAVNDANYRGFEAGTLLMAAPIPQQERSGNSVLWTVTFVCRFDANGWNNRFRPGAGDNGEGEYQPITKTAVQEVADVGDETPNPPHPAVSFASIIDNVTA